MAKEALSLDLDGVVVARIPFQWSAVPRLLNRPPLDFSPPTDVPIIDRTIVEQRLGLKDHINYIRHSMPVRREARQVIPELAQTMDIYGNSGRVNTSTWVEKADAAFKRAGIKDHFKGVYFKPPGTRGLLSKMAAVTELREKYDSVTHVDDNPQDALPIARAFPDVKVVILQDLSTGLLVSMKELQQYPNVRRVARLRDLLPDQQVSNLSVSQTRNSKLREVTANPIQSVTDRLHETFPSLTPNQITALGAIGTAIGSAMAASGETDSKVMPLSILTTSALLDAFDGALARKIETEKPGSIDFKKGAIYDSISDRTQELFMALSRAIQAYKRGDKLGQISALLNGISNSLPSTAKAYAETRGVAVSESGKGIAGFLGTRVGRATMGITTTVFPEMRGAPIQVIADALVTSANLSTAIDRISAAQRLEPTLSEETRNDSKARFRALATFTALALGATVMTYLQLRESNKPKVQIEKEKTEANSDEERYNKILLGIEDYCYQNQLDHRFVGGTLTDLIGSQTELDIDIGTRTIRLIEPNSQTMTRPDGTVKDIDLVIFSDDQQAFVKAKETFESWSQIAQTANMPFPQISVEAAYHPSWPSRNKLKQFVSAFEMDQEGKLYLAFGDTTQQISKESIEPWHITLDNGTRLTVFNPLAHRLCYELRVPSGLKPKDLDKMPTLVGFSSRVIEAGTTNGVDYMALYGDWQSYILKLHNHPDPLTRVKAGITGLYWRTLGTQIAHGSGFLGGLSKFNNKMNG